MSLENGELPVAMNTPIGIANIIASRGVTTRFELSNRASGCEASNAVDSTAGTSSWVAQSANEALAVRIGAIENLISAIDVTYWVIL